MKTYKFISLNNLKGGGVYCSKLHKLNKEIKQFTENTQKNTEYNAIPHSKFIEYVQSLSSKIVTTIITLLNENNYIDLLEYIRVPNNIDVSIYDMSIGEIKEYNMSIFSLNISITRKLLTETTIVNTLTFNNKKINMITFTDTSNTSNTLHNLHISKIFPFKKYLLIDSDVKSNLEKLKSTFELYLDSVKNIEYEHTYSKDTSKIFTSKLNLDIFYVIFKLICGIRENYVMYISNSCVKIKKLTDSDTSNVKIRNFFDKINGPLNDNVVTQLTEQEIQTLKSSARKDEWHELWRETIKTIIRNTDTFLNEISEIYIPGIIIKKNKNIYILNNILYFTYNENSIYFQIHTIILKFTKKSIEGKNMSLDPFSFTLINKNKYIYQYIKQTKENSAELFTYLFSYGETNLLYSIRLNSNFINEFEKVSIDKVKDKTISIHIDLTKNITQFILELIKKINKELPNSIPEEYINTFFKL